MDFQIIGNESLRIKSKKVSIAIDPRKEITKIDAEAILLTDKLSDVSRVNDYRIIFDGSGEYEVSGLKITGIKADSKTVFELVSEGTNILIARASAIANLSAEQLDEYKIVVINVDSELNQSMITAMEPRAIILYGDLKKEGAKKLGKETVSPVAKFSISEEKLPDELEIILLG